MSTNNQINVPMSGMDRDSHPSRIKENTYTFLKNLNYEDTSGNGFPLIQSEPSNLLCQDFKESLSTYGGYESYMIVGHRYNPIMDRTYMFLTNEDKGSKFYGTSIIGYIKSGVKAFERIDEESMCGCIPLGILDTPLEKIDQENLCSFKIVLEDSCTRKDKTSKGCLNFSSSNPIFEKNIRFKNEQCGVRMYWTDRDNPPRYLDITNSELSDWKENPYLNTGEIGCGQDKLVQTCLDCDKLKMIPDFSVPEITPTNIELGGNLKLGTYEFLIAYCDEEGNELSDYYSHTTPVNLFDYNDVFMDQTGQDRVSNYAIELKVSNLDTRFHYYSVAVIQNTGVNGEESYFIEGIHPISDTSVIYTSDRNKKATTLKNIYNKKPRVKSVEHMIDSNGFLFMAGIKNKPVLNFQPVVNLMGPYLKWVTTIAKEDFYKNGINASLSRSYMRDEVYPYSIVFGFKDGTETNDFILINRGPSPYEIQRVDGNVKDLNVKSIVKGKNACGGNDRVFRWQFENTASSRGLSSAIPKCVTKEDSDKYVKSLIANGAFKKRYFSSCTVTETGGLNIGTNIEVVLGDDFRPSDSIQDYLNENILKYKDSSYSNYSYDFAKYLYEDRYADFHCDSNTSCNCTDSVIKNRYSVVSSITVSKDENEKDLIRYEYLPFSEMKSKELAYIESLFPDTGRDADITFSNRYIYKGYGKAHLRGVRKEGNTPDSPAPLKLLSNIDVESESGYTLPNIGTRSDKKNILFSEYTADTIADNAKWYMDPVYISSSTKDKADDNMFNFVEKWGVIQVDQKFEPGICRNALWVEFNDIADKPFLQINFKSSSPLYQPINTSDTLESQSTYNDIKLTLENDVVRNRVGKVRIAIFKKGVPGKAIKTLFVSNSKSHIINIQKELNTEQGEYILSIDTPIQRLNAYEVSFVRKIDYSGLKPGVTETPEDFRYWDRGERGDSIRWVGFINNTPIFHRVSGNKSFRYRFDIKDPLPDDKAWSSVSGTVLMDSQSYTSTSVDNSFFVTQRGREVVRSIVTLSSLQVDVVEEYEEDCYFEDLSKKVCDGDPYEEGKFAYHESTEIYPDNVELFDSSRLNITEKKLKSIIDRYITDKWKGHTYSDQAETILTTFKQNFSSLNKFLDKDKANFACKPIRHFKFPNNAIAPFIYTNEVLEWNESFIFPLGVSIDTNVVNIFLDLAVETGLVSEEQRKEISYFRLKRGDRTLEKSVLSKGLISDVIKYKEGDDEKYIANFPFNSLSPKELILQDKQPLKHPYKGLGNNKFVFNSPEVETNVKLLPTEITIEGFQYGASETKVNSVKDHAKMVVLNQSALNLALNLARAESAFEFATMLADLGIQVAQASSGGGFLGFGGLAAGVMGGGLLAGVIVLRSAQQRNRTEELKLKWIDTFRNLGVGSNFAHYISSVGHYNNFSKFNNKNYTLRYIENSTLLKDSQYNINNLHVGGFVSVNNIDREKSLFIDLGKDYKVDGIVYPQEFTKIDDSNTEPPEFIRLKTGYTGNVANLYAGLKLWRPDQYGTITNIKWIDIPGRTYLDSKDQVIMFGGDTFISKYSFKKKFNFFLVSELNQADFTSFKYSRYFNIVRPKYYIDYDSEDISTGSSLIPVKGSIYNLRDEGESGKYISEGKFYHYQYGIPYFFVESTINCWNRYSGEEPWENFYPNVGDYVEWTQEKTVSIRRPNVLKYNFAYSKPGSPKVGNHLPSTFVNKFYNCINNSPNGIMYSAPDSSEKQRVDPWLVYRNFDFFNFPSSNGKLINLLNIESTQILGIFENEINLFNAVDTTNGGAGGVFAQRPVGFHTTDQGYGGTQHKASVSCEFGHFWADAKRGQVFQSNPNGQGISEITAGMRNWFKEHLPFKILKGNIEGLSSLDLDNPYKNLGIVMGFDSRFKRVFLTKLDYIVKPDYVGKLEYSSDTEEVEDSNLMFLSINKTFKLKSTKEEVSLQNKDIFEFVGFTVAYSPIFKSWISYYDFTPGMYIDLGNHFMTGGNMEGVPSIWSHLLTNKSYGVFYGKKYTWELEFPTKEQYAQKSLTHVEFWMDSIRYHNDYDYSLNTNIGLDYAWIYNNSNSSGKIKLVPRQINNRFQATQYPKVGSDGTEVLATFDEGKWSFNDFFNRVRKDNMNTPLWFYDKNAVKKTMNNRILSFNQSWLDRLRGDWFLVRLEGGSDSRFKQMFKWVNPEDKVIY